MRKAICNRLLSRKVKNIGAFALGTIEEREFWFSPAIFKQLGEGRGSLWVGLWGMRRKRPTREKGRACLEE